MVVFRREVMELSRANSASATRLRKGPKAVYILGCDILRPRSNSLKHYCHG